MAIIRTNEAFVVSSSVVSPLGIGVAENMQNVFEKQTGLSIKKKEHLGGDFCTSEVNPNVLNDAFEKHGNPNLFTKLEKMSIISIADALHFTSINASSHDTLFIFCTTKGNINKLENQHKSFENVQLSSLALKIAHFFGFKHMPMVVSNACISGTQGIVLAQRLLKAGAYKNIIVTGADLVSDFTLSGFKAFGALSSTFCQPFDLNRHGVNLGEAAATIVLSADSYSSDCVRVVDGHISNDATHISAPSRTGEGLFRILDKISSRNLVEIDFISAHGTATRYNDDMESQAFFRASFSETPINSLKGYFGHTLGAAGVLESVINLESLKMNQTILSLGFKEAGTVQPVNVISTSATKQLNAFIKTSSGFGGCNGAVLFKK